MDKRSQFFFILFNPVSIQIDEVENLIVFVLYDVCFYIQAYKYNKMYNVTFNRHVGF